MKVASRRKLINSIVIWSELSEKFNDTPLRPLLLHWETSIDIGSHVCTAG